MSKYDEKASRSELYKQVIRSPLNAGQRAIVVNALRNAEALTDGIMWVVNAIQRLTTGTGARVGRLTHDH